MVVRLIVVLFALAAGAAAEARDGRAPRSDNRCDPERVAPSGAGIDACAPFAFNPAPGAPAPDPRAASEPLLPMLEPPGARNVLTPRGRP